MKKVFVLCGIALCVAFVAAGCKSSESAYRKAYEKAKANETVVVEEPVTTVVTPMTGSAVTPMKEVKPEEKVVDNYDNVNVRQEKLNVLDGNGLKAYSVVVGAFGLKANAESLVSRLRSQGYPAQLAFNAERNMYRVIVSTFDTKNEAAASRDQMRASFSDAWLLYNVK